MAQDNLETKLMDKIVALCKRRGFIFPGSEIYGGMANSWDYGPVGVELKNNIKSLWWKRFVQQKDDIVGLDASLIMNPKVWEASGHLANFTDPLKECRKCHLRLRADHVEAINELREKSGPHVGAVSMSSPQKTTSLIESQVCSRSEYGRHEWTETKTFNLMFKTFVGPAEESANVAYFRPETAQAMFVDFKNVLDTTRVRLPFGIAQIGKAFRNEITPGNFIFRTREFELMEIEYFINPPKTDEEWQKVFEEWRLGVLGWIRDDLGVSMEKIHELDVPEKERAHYSKKTIDFEYDFPFGRSELYGLAYRTDFDLKNHSESSGQNLRYKDPETQEEYFPHVIEPAWGVDRSVLVVLIDSYKEEDGRIYLKLKPDLAPFKAAIFPLLANKPELVEKARGIYEDLKANFMVAWDDRGNIGKRYASQDEVGTPYCITIDFDTLKDDTVTVRDRDSTKQERVNTSEIKQYLLSKLE